jgi:hypothetical protein
MPDTKKENVLRLQDVTMQFAVCRSHNLSLEVNKVK